MSLAGGPLEVAGFVEALNALQARNLPYSTSHTVSSLPSLPDLILIIHRHPSSRTAPCLPCVSSSSSPPTSLTRHSRCPLRVTKQIRRPISIAVSLSSHRYPRYTPPSLAPALDGLCAWRCHTFPAHRRYDTNEDLGQSCR